MSYTLFISDLHLSPNHPHLSQLFMQFLKKYSNKTDAIYILGDFFETWIGDDDYSDFHCTIKDALKKIIAAGTPIYFLHGNRDFLIGKKFLAETGCQLLSEETCIKLYDETILLMHGDTLCTLDINYQKLRKWLQQPLLQILFLKLPLFFRRKIASHLRAKSTRYINTMTPEIMDVTEIAVNQVMQKHQAHYLIHGHTHKQNTHIFILNHETHTRFVLGAWHAKGNALIWHSTGEKEFIEF